MPRPYLLAEANYRQQLDYRPNVAVLPWGATEAHNYHLPYGTDNYTSQRFAERAAEVAYESGGKPVVLPGIPFGNNAQQLDQVCTIHFCTTTAAAILNDVCRSLKKQGIDRLVILNGHGGNMFKPLVRDAQLDHGLLIVVADFFRFREDLMQKLFLCDGDHADDMETSLMLHLFPETVVMEQAGEGSRVPFDIPALKKPGPWTPRPWQHAHPDTGSGNPRPATAEKGKQYFDAIAEELGQLLLELSKAAKGQSPYL